MQTSLRSISSTFGSWLGTENGDGRKKISLDTCKSFGEKKKKKRHWTWDMETRSFQFYPLLSSHHSEAQVVLQTWLIYNPSTPYLTELLMKCHILLPSGRRTFFTQRCKNNVSIHPSVLQTEKAYSILWMIPVWKDKKGKAVTTLLLCCGWALHEFQAFPPVMCCSSWDFSPAQEGTVCASCPLSM